VSDQWEGCEEVHWDCRIAQLEAELARRDDLIKRLVEDGERLADNYIAAKRMICACFGADYQDDEIITLHRALMKELGHEGEK